MESKALLEVRKIRDELSVRYSNMSIEQIKQEHEKSRTWFEKQIGRPLPTANTKSKDKKAG